MSTVVQAQEIAALPFLDTGVRPQVKGKFLFAGTEKLYIRGVTYGPFRPQDDGYEYHTPEQVELDFAQMAANGLNAVRLYTVPPHWLLDAAQRYGLWVMVGLPWEQHITFLDDDKRIRDIEQRMRAAVRRLAGHPSLFCYAIGNEIPASLVRWHGRRRVERFLARLYRAVKKEDPDSLVTYVNYPSTEYLELDFVDFCCFNVYLESQGQLEAYLARLQNLAGEKPLVMAEIGLDSRRNGEEMQGEVLDWQLRTVFAAGCAGCFIFAWTDEWHRGGFDIEDWDFGLTSRDRRPKTALSIVRQAFAEVPVTPNRSWPRVSVAVCSYNGARTIRDTLEGLQELNYPDYEVIVVDDGSTNGVSEIARTFAVRLIRTENRGLSSARNTALEAATGEIVAYIDDDARPDPHWLNYLVLTLVHGDYAGAGGPNIAPPGDGPVAKCVANAPGGPIHVLLSDREAEHIPGCNMAFWKERLQEIDGFDPRFRAAGDDVDVCWRLQQQGWKLGFSPAAVVWHHRRNSMRAYWRQQKGYGRAEAMLEMKWPEKYNPTGHLRWSGRLYGKGLLRLLGRGPGRIYHGTWGVAPFQSLYAPAEGLLQSLPAMPEWLLVLIGLAVLTGLGALWKPLLGGLPLLGILVTVSVVMAALSASAARFVDPPRSRLSRFGLCTLTTLLYLVQPFARLLGRLQLGLTPWRRRGALAYAFPRRRREAVWSESWRPAEKWLQTVETTLREQGVVTARGGDFDLWDLDIRGGLLGGWRLLMTIEEHGGGRQLVQFRSWPKCAPAGFALALVFGGLAWGAAADQVWLVAAFLGILGLLLLLSVFADCAGAASACRFALEQLKVDEEKQPGA